MADIESVHQHNLKEANAAYAASLSDDDKSLPLPPGKKYAVGKQTSPAESLPTKLNTPAVTCMDARIHAPQAFGISLGDAHIIRNAGGSAPDALRSLTISQQLLGTEEIIVIKHTGRNNRSQGAVMKRGADDDGTGYGMLTFENKDIQGVVDAQLGVQTEDDYLPFKE